MSTLVVLGAADGSLSTYRTATALGYRTIAVDRSPTAPGIALATEYLPLSTRDVPAIRAALAGRTDLAGVVAPCSDIAVPTLRALAVAFGLPTSLSAAAAAASVDKELVRSVIDELGVPAYRWIAGPDPFSVADHARDLHLPVVVKPADAQSGRGVARCATFAAVDAAVEEAWRQSYGGRIMVEEEVVGIHCSAECIVEDGTVAFMALTRTLLSSPPLTMTLGHRMPADLPVGVEDRVRAIVEKLCARLDYRLGPLNLDLVVASDGEPHIVELGLRTGGNGMDDLVRHSYGVDPIRAAIQAAVGRPIETHAHPPRHVMWRVLAADRAGELVSITGAARAAALPGVAELVLLAEPGQAVRPFHDVADKLGWAVLRADTAAGLDLVADELTRTLRFEVR